jgi:hypothetical protein
VTGAGGGAADELVLGSAPARCGPQDHYVDANISGEGSIIAWRVRVTSSIAESRDAGYAAAH